MSSNALCVEQELFDVHEALLAKLTPKRYEQISGPYVHPNVWAKHLARVILSAVYFADKDQKTYNKGQVHILLTTAKLAALEMPYYYVSEAFLADVASTKLPDDMQFGELQWPAAAVTFGLPVGFVKKYTGFNVEIPFLAGSLHPYSTIVDPTEDMPVFSTYSHCVPRVKIDKPRLTIIFEDELDKRVNQGVTASYGSSHYLDTKLSDIQKTVHETWSDGLDAALNPENLQNVPLNLSHEEEGEVNRKMCLLFVKLLTVLACEGPKYLEHDRISKPAKVKGDQVCRPAYWQVPFLGRSYSVPKEAEDTHASPRRHLRRRHVTRQAIGPRDKVVYAASLPRTPDGKTDWDKVTPAMKDAFWKSHEVRWIRELIVKADDEGIRAKDQLPD